MTARHFIRRGGAAVPRSLVTHKLLSENPEHIATRRCSVSATAFGLAADAPLPNGVIDASRWDTRWRPTRCSSRRAERTLADHHQGLFAGASHPYPNRAQALRPPHRPARAVYERVVEIDERMTGRGRELRPPSTITASVTAKSPRAYRCRHPLGRHLVCCAAFAIRHERLPRAGARDRFTRSLGQPSRQPARSWSPWRPPWSMLSLAVPAALWAIRPGCSRLAGAPTRLIVMQSKCRLVCARRFHGRMSILSGRPLTLVGASAPPRRWRLRKIERFDWGGTSTDVRSMPAN